MTSPHLATRSDRLPMLRYSTMDIVEAEQFARQWAQDWNAHDLDQVLTHFADNVVFTSPVAEQLVPGTGGVIRGKAALRKYWTEGLRRIADLRFDVIGVYAGVDTVVINYRNQKATLVCEVLTFRGGEVVAGHGTYATSGDPAGARD
jgi:ketosteroid isomerase-like protein